MRTIASACCFLLLLAACQTVSRVPVVSELIDESETHKSYLEGRNVRVEYYGCPDGVRMQTLTNLSSLDPYPRELALIDATILLGLISNCHENRQRGAGVDEDGEELQECRNVYFQVGEPLLYHIANVCPGADEAHRPTERYCGPVQFLDENEPSERCLIVFAD